MYAFLSSLLRNITIMVSLSFNIRLVLVIIALLVLQQQHSSADHVLFGTRKMLVYKFSSKVVKQEQMTDDISVTGDTAFDSTTTSLMNAQVDSEILKKNARNSLGIIHFSEQNHERSKKEESKEFVDAEGEVAKLMSKDYVGKNVPRRKPPINNHKPTD